MPLGVKTKAFASTRRLESKSQDWQDTYVLTAIVRYSRCMRVCVCERDHVCCAGLWSCVVLAFLLFPRRTSISFGKTLDGPCRLMSLCRHTHTCCFPGKRSVCLVRCMNVVCSEYAKFCQRRPASFPFVLDHDDSIDQAGLDKGLAQTAAAWLVLVCVLFRCFECAALSARMCGFVCSM